MAAEMYPGNDMPGKTFTGPLSCTPWYKQSVVIIKVRNHTRMLSRRHCACGLVDSLVDSMPAGSPLPHVHFDFGKWHYRHMPHNDIPRWSRNGAEPSLMPSDSRAVLMWSYNTLPTCLWSCWCKQTYTASPGRVQHTIIYSK